MFSSDKGRVRRAGGARGDLRGRRACGEGTPVRRSWWVSAASAAFIGLSCFRLFIDVAGGDLAFPSPAADELGDLARTYLAN